MEELFNKLITFSVQKREIEAIADMYLSDMKDFLYRHYRNKYVGIKKVYEGLEFKIHDIQMHNVYVNEDMSLYFQVEIFFLRTIKPTGDFDVDLATAKKIQKAVDFYTANSRFPKRAGKLICGSIEYECWHNKGNSLPSFKLPEDDKDKDRSFLNDLF
jgi:hypothetical protein